MGIWQVGIARLLLLQLLIASAFAADLQNPDFEKPPTNIPKNSTNQFIPLNSIINTLPGWSYQGTVQYVISSGQGGNAIYLGQDGKINQTFKAIGEFDLNYDYLLTFNLKPAQPNCTSPTSVTISVPNRSVVVSFEKKFGNQNTDGLIKDGQLIKEKKNLVLNDGFEVGPAFPNNSYGGILIDAESNPSQSPLNQWAVLGTVKYITNKNKNYEIPEGDAAIELVLGKSSGVQTTVTLKKDSEYKMKVFFSGKNDACIGKDSGKKN
ncbi:hypothetical protein MKW92_053008 [Papaver armeniacum]|nr:hypothetical protein MKW92_053008 [Papaver armeniacum]